MRRDAARTRSRSRSRYAALTGLPPFLAEVSRTTGRPLGSRAKLSHRFDGFWTRLGYEDNRAAFIAKSGAHAIGQILLVLLGEQFVAVDEQEKGGWGLADLRRVKEFEPVAPIAHGLA